jgi:hypothetical protein
VLLVLLLRARALFFAHNYDSFGSPSSLQQLQQSAF